MEADDVALGYERLEIDVVKKWVSGRAWRIARDHLVAEGVEAFG